MELRAAVSLARVWAEDGERKKAHAVLAPVHGWFTEGLNGSDLQEARTLLATLGRNSAWLRCQCGTACPIPARRPAVSWESRGAYHRIWAATSVWALSPQSSSHALAPAWHKAETVFRIGNVGEPGSLDPQQISSTYENCVVGDMFLGLTTEAADGSMVPGAAESWTIDDDGRVYTFKLRDHKWSDGQTVTADDFVFAFRRVLEPSFAGILPRCSTRSRMPRS